MNKFKKVRVTLLGQDIDHKTSLIAMIKEHCGSIGWVPDSQSVLKKWHTFKVLRQINRFFDQATYTRDKNYLHCVFKHLDQFRSDIVLAYWGTNILSDVVAIKKFRPKVKIVLVVLCHPLAIDSIGVFRQNWMMRRAANWLDGILYPNKVMADYFHSEVLGAYFNKLPYLVLPPCWPKSYQSTIKPPRTTNKANIIYVGRTDLSSHTIHSGDDLRPLMHDILDAGIELHHVQSPETSDNHPGRNPFTPLNHIDLIAKMATHDASLIAYNLGACKRADRFQLTVPDRLITSVAAGLPIAVPAKGYSGLKAYLTDYPAIFQFNSAVDLKRQLDDRVRVEFAHDSAWDARKYYTAEKQGKALVTFLTQFI